MLLELTVTDFAIIDHLQLSFCPHLNVFTGETGAGKSIIVDAISALVGERVGADVVRTGAERAIVEGIFDVGALAEAPVTTGDSGTRGDDGDEGRSLADALGELGIEPEDGALILSREILQSGRGIARINRRAVPLSSLQRVARFLIDIHGQSAHLALLRPEQHVYYLDRYANTTDLRLRVADLVGQWRAARREADRMRRDEREIERRIELLRYQVEEIEAARLRPGEIEELETERRRLANAERLGELCATVYAALAGDETGDAAGAIDTLSVASRALGELLRLDDSLSDQLTTLDQAVYQLQDVASAARSYQDEVAADPERQAEVEERLDLIAKLRRKYGATVEEILAYAAESARELDDLTHREERATELREREVALRDRIGALAGELSQRRAQSGIQLAQAMERELNELNMQRARFQVQIGQRHDPDGAPARVAPSGETERYAFGPTGIDTVEFLIAPNQGESFKPLVRIASGGETSRLMLALKTILSRADIVPILIFDEIDAGVSGRAGQTVGEKLWQLGQTHQVLCVTHLAQIAALGDCHYRVAKALRAERTTTQVETLSARERAVELGQLIGGRNTTAARAAAEELLTQADLWKHDGAIASHGA